MEENLIAIRDPTTFYFDFDWLKDIDEHLKHKTEFIIKSNESFAENRIKNEIEQWLSKYQQRNNIHELGKLQTNESHKFVLNLSKRLDLRSSMKHIRKQYEKNKLKIMGPTWNNEFELPDGS